jgi:hypothetical protein
MSTSTTNPTIQRGKDALAFGRGILQATINGFDETNCTHQTESARNHALWVIGHIAMTDDFFMTSMGGAESSCPEAWNELFGMKSEPVNDPGKYPALSELTAKLEETRAKLIAWFEGMSEEHLNEPMPDEMKMFAPTIGSVMSSIAIHEGYHAGQLTCVRKSLGMPRIVG